MRSLIRVVLAIGLFPLALAAQERNKSPSDSARTICGTVHSIRVYEILISFGDAKIPRQRTEVKFDDGRRFVFRGISDTPVRKGKDYIFTVKPRPNSEGEYTLLEPPEAVVSC